MTAEHMTTLTNSNKINSMFVNKGTCIHKCIKIYRTIILPVVLYVCETWSLSLREEHRLRVSENRVLRRIFGPKRDGVTEE